MSCVKGSKISWSIHFFSLRAPLLILLIDRMIYISWNKDPAQRGRMASEQVSEYVRERWPRPGDRLHITSHPTTHTHHKEMKNELLLPWFLINSQLLKRFVQIAHIESYLSPYSYLSADWFYRRRHVESTKAKSTNGISGLKKE